MGYRDAGFDARAETGFSAQFEWDGNRWLFRRRGRVAPVEVSREEMITSIERYENGTIVLVALLFGALLFGALLEPAWVRILVVSERASGALIGFGSGLLFCVAHFGLVKAVTRPFAARPTQGVGRSWLEVRRTWVQQRSWRAILAVPALFVLMVGVKFWLDETVDWSWIGIVGLFVAITAFDAWLKLRFNRL